MHAPRWPLLALTTALGCLVGCAPAAEDTSPELGVAYAALGPNATVADAIESECSTASIKPLGQQLIDEVQCEHPGTFERIDDIDNVVIGEATFPWLQRGAAEALHIVASKRDGSMTINSAYRSVAQQLMLYSWYRNGRRCGISLAAKPGNSNHESALAVDVDEPSAWRSTFDANGFTWLGSKDPVHFDYTGDGPTADLGVLSVAAFQTLWNRNHPDDVLEEDGEYGPATEARILRAPAAGFALGASCMNPPAGDAGAPVDAGAGVDAGADAGAPLELVPPDFGDEGGCSMHAVGSTGSLWFALGLLGLRRRAARSA